MARQGVSHLFLLCRWTRHQSIMTDGLTGCVTPVFVVQLDTVTQRLIGVLGKAGPGKAADNRMYDANIACRKLAARHPMLILR